MLKDYRTSVTNLKLTKEQFSIIDAMSYRTKALYNTALYQINNHFNLYKEGIRKTYIDKQGNTKEQGSYIGYQTLDKLMKTIEDQEGNILYKSIPAQIAQQTLKKLDKNYSSFFKLLSKKNNNEYDKSIETPKYKRKEDRKEIIFVKSKTSRSFIFKDNFIYITVSKDLHKGRLKLCRVPKYIEDLDFDTEIKYIEIIPKLGRYELHITYEKEIEEVNTELSRFYSIDLGMNNMLAVSSNCTNAFLVSGRGIKSINQKYNKRIARLKSKTKKSQGRNTSKKIKELYNTRGYKLSNEIHKITDFITKSIVKHSIDHVVIGYNKEWKQNIKLGKKTNQNFVQIPFYKILQQLEYKLKALGIEVFLQEESYTSKCSYLDNEEVQRHQTYKGNRNKRGLFTTSLGVYINADINGSLNIYRKFLVKNKVVHDVLLEPVDIGLVMNPIKIHLQTSMSSDEVLTLVRSL